MATRRRALAGTAALVLALAMGGCAGGTDAGSVTDSDIAEEAVPDTASGAIADTDADGAMPDSEPAPDAGSVAVCPLLAGLDVGALLGEAAAEPTDSAGICTVDPIDAASPASLVLQVVGTPDGASYFERDKALLGSDAEIPGLGDAAYTAGKRVNILVGDNYLYLQVLRNPVGGAGQVDGESLLAAARTALTNAGW